MLESVFIMFIAMGFILFILGIEMSSVVYAITSTLMWIIILAGQLYIEVPTDTIYDEPAFYAVGLGFIIMNIIWIIIIKMDYSFTSEHIPPHLR